MTTFSRPGGNGDMTSNDPAAISVTATNVGGLLTAVIMERSGGDHTNHVLTDNAGGSELWNFRYGITNEPDEGDFRFTASVWDIIVETEHTSSFTLTGDDGTAANKSISWAEWASSGAYDWTFELFKIIGSVQADWDDLDSGSSADPGGSDLFEYASAGSRIAGIGSFPTAVDFSTQTDAKGLRLGGQNTWTHISACEAAGQASGAKSSIVLSDGVDNEGWTSVAIYSDGGVPLVSFPPFNPSKFQPFLVR